ncbi:MAG: CIA30 family protein [Chitinispirillaceae bacterium]|nr:CIA30 family protein [Chitinispirillaceae bacterium]
MNVLRIAALITAFSAMRLSADMIDDFEDGDYQNETGFSWFYTMVPCDDEVIINNAMPDEYGMLGMLPVAGIGYDEGYAAELSWKFGSKPADCTYERLVSLAGSLWFDSQGGGVGWYKATEISFYAKASTTLTTRVQFILSGAPIALFHKDIAVTPEWTRCTVPFSELVLDESSEPVEFQSDAIRKIQFIIMEYSAGTPDSGTLLIDDVEVNDTVIPSYINILTVEPSDPGKSSELQGTLLADFEGDGQGDSRPEISKFKTPWYLFDDSDKAGAGNSVFTGGVQLNPEDSTAMIQINVGGKEGFDSTQGLKVSFKLGNPIRDGEEITQPFVGIGCMLSNSDEYLSGADTSLKTADLSEATGIYFDYKTVATNDKFRHFEFELYDTDSLPEGNSFHKEIPATGGVWRGVIIPFADLDPPVDFDSLTADQRSLDRKKIDRIQFRFQNIKGTGIDVYLDNIKFAGNVCAPYGCDENVVSPVNYKHTSVTFQMCTNGLKVTLKSLPGGTHNGYVELIGINGVVIAREKIHTSDSYSLLIKTDRLSAGVYIIRVNTRYGEGKIYSFTDRISVLN